MSMKPFFKIKEKSSRLRPPDMQERWYGTWSIFSLYPGVLGPGPPTLFNNKGQFPGPATARHFCRPPNGHSRGLWKSPIWAYDGAKLIAGS